MENIIKYSSDKVSYKDQHLIDIENLIKDIRLNILEKEFQIIVKRDVECIDKIPSYKKISVAITDGNITGKKWYIDDDFTNDKILRVIFSAFKSFINYEIVVGFKYKDVWLFNPKSSR